MKKLEIRIEVTDTNHNPVNGAWRVSISSQAPFLTVDRIIKAIEQTTDAEGCRFKLLDGPQITK